MQLLVADNSLLDASGCDRAWPFRPFECTGATCHTCCSLTCCKLYPSFVDIDPCISHYVMTYVRELPAYFVIGGVVDIENAPTKLTTISHFNDGVCAIGVMRT